MNLRLDQLAAHFPNRVIGALGVAWSTLFVAMLVRRRACKSIAIVAFLFIQEATAFADDPFATRVVSFDPAPGQFANVADLNDPARALGPPEGGGTKAPNNASLVSLGDFGGSITLAFDHTVLDDPRNAFGMDAIVFGNAFWSGGNPSDHWAEVAFIEISLDGNVPGEADDPWFLIPGSHITDLSAQHLVRTWDDRINDSTFPPDMASWIPPGFFGEWDTEGYALPAKLFGELVVRNPSSDPAVEGIFGYAEYSPTLLLGDFDADNLIDDFTIGQADFYTVPDDPHAVGMTRGSGGGDAFDIAWAIDPATGLPANLPGFDFIRITSAVSVAPGITGEKSAEIDAVADVKPDPFGDADEDGDIDLRDLAILQECMGMTGVAETGCARLDVEPDDLISLEDSATMTVRMTGPAGGVP